MTEEELVSLGDVQCRIIGREYPSEIEGNLATTMEGLKGLPGYVSAGKQVFLSLECGWIIGALESLSDYILSKPRHVQQRHLVVQPEATHVRCPVCSGDLRRSN